MDFASFVKKKYYSGEEEQEQQRTRSAGSSAPTSLNASFLNHAKQRYAQQQVRQHNTAVSGVLEEQRKLRERLQDPRYGESLEHNIGALGSRITAAASSETSTPEHLRELIDRRDNYTAQKYVYDIYNGRNTQTQTSTKKPRDSSYDALKSEYDSLVAERNRDYHLYSNPEYAARGQELDARISELQGQLGQYVSDEQQRRAETEAAVADARKTLANGFDYDELTRRRDNLAWQLDNLSPNLDRRAYDAASAGYRQQIAELDSVLERIRDAKRTIADYEGSEAGRAERAAALEQQAWADAEFSAYAAQGLKMDTNRAVTLMQGGSIDYRNVSDIRLGDYGGASGASSVEGNLNADELLTYSYLLAKHGEDAANSYLDSARDRVNQRIGAARAEQILGINNPLLRAAAIGAQGAESGLDRFGSGIAQMFTNEQIPASPTQNASTAISENLTPVGKFAYDFVTTTANMAPSILLSAVTAGLGSAAGIAGAASVGKAVGTAAMGASSAGNAYNQAIAEGRSVNEARSYSLLVGASEAGLQYLLGGVTKLGGKVSGSVLAKKIATLDGVYKQAAAKWGLSMLSEGTEEALQSVIEPLFASLIFDESYDAAAFGEVAYSFLLGALSAGVLEGGDVAIAGWSRDRNVGTAAAALGDTAIDGIIANGMEADASSSARRLAVKLNALKESDKKISPQALGRLARLSADETNRKAAALSAASPQPSAPGVAPRFNPETGGFFLPTAQEQMDAVLNRGGGYLPNAYDTGTSQQLRDTLDTLGRTFGKVYTFADSITSAAGTRANGVYSGNIIAVSRDADQAIPWVVGHETGHMLKTMAPAEWTQFQNEAVRLMGDEALQRTYKQYSADNPSFTMEAAREELTADFLGNIIFDEKTLTQFVSEMESAIKAQRVKPNVLQRIIDAIREFVAKIRRQTAAQRGAYNLARVGIDLKSANNAVAMLENVVKRATSFTPETSEETPKFTFAGQHAHNMDAASYGLAISMEQWGRSADEIFRQTGWFRGADGRWRFEIDDSNMRYDAERVRRFNYEKIYGTSDPDSLRLGDILDHPQLFEAYPKLRDAKIVFKWMSGNEQGNYSAARNTITLNSQIKTAPEDVLLHEIQHAIQRIEGFSPGASTGYWSVRLRQETGRLPTEEEKMNSYLNTAGEIEARDVVERRRLTDEQRREIFPNIGDENTLHATALETPLFPDGEPQYSLEMLPDGRKYVRADRQVIFGNDPVSWGEQVESYINGKIRNGEDVKLIADDGDVLTLTSDTAGKAKHRYRPDGSQMSDNEYETKLNAEAHIDELARISSRGRKTVADYGSIHGDLANAGWNYRTAYFLDFDGKYYMLTISVAMGEKGNVVYNIGKIQERSFPNVSGSSANGGAQGGETSFETSISETSENVNPKFSLQDTAAGSDIELLNAREIVPLNDIASRDKYDYLVMSFASEGWSGRPIVVVRDGSGAYQALTGSHRVSAAASAGIVVPAVIIEYSRELDELMDARSDEDRAAEAETLYAEGMISAEVYSLLVREDDLNYENHGVPFDRQARYNFSNTADTAAGRAAEREAQEIEAEIAAEDEQARGVLKLPTVADEIFNALPRKAQDYARRVEKKFVGWFGHALQVPKPLRRDLLNGAVHSMAAEYINAGTISDKTLERLFNEAYDKGFGMDQAYYNKYKHIATPLRETAIMIADADIDADSDFKVLLKAASRSLRISKEGGVPVGELYKQMRDLAPGLFEARLTRPNDQVRELFEVSKSLAIAERMIAEHSGEDAETFRRWARRDFNSAAADLMNELRVVRRYAAERVGDEEVVYVPETLEEAQELYAAYKVAKRKSEKAVSKNLLTEEDDQTVGRLLRGELTLRQLPRGANGKGIREVHEAKAEVQKYEKTIEAYKAKHAEALDKEAETFLVGTEEWKDKSAGILYSRETMERNIRDIAPDTPEGKAQAESIITRYFTPVHDAEAKSNILKNELREKIRALGLSRVVRKGDEVSESAAVQMLGEAEANIEWLKENPKTSTRSGKTLMEWNSFIANLWEMSPSLDRGKIRAATETFREIYDSLFRMMNEARVRNGYEPVDYRKGYFPHFQEDSGDGLLAMIAHGLGISAEVTELPTSISGITHTFKPGINWMGNALNRKGFKTDYDALLGFDRYVEAATRVIYQTDNIQRLRALERQIRRRTTDEELQKRWEDALKNLDIEEMSEEMLSVTRANFFDDNRVSLTNFVGELKEYTDILAGKKSIHDRGSEQDASRRMYNITKALTSRVAANMVAVNPASWLTNFIPLTQAWSSIGTVDMLRAMRDTVKSIWQADGFVERSTFLVNRRGSDPLAKAKYGRQWEHAGTRAVQRFGQTVREKVEQSGKMPHPMEWIDQFVSDTIVRARHSQNLRRGLGEDEAMIDANAFAAGVIADRSRGAMPTLFERRNPMTKLFTQFQLEVNNQLSFLFKDIPRDAADEGMKKLALMLLKFAFGAWLFNELYEFFIGRRPALDPIDMIVNDVGGNLIGYEIPNLPASLYNLVSGNDAYEPFSMERERSIGQAGTDLATSVLESLPFTSALALTGLDIDAGRIPVSNAIPDIGGAWTSVTDADNSWKKKVADVASELSKPVFYLVPPFGGSALKKFLQGARAVYEGGSYSIDKDGEYKLQYPVYSDSFLEGAGNLVRATLFGKTASAEAQEWINSGFKTLGTKPTEAYRSLRTLGIDERSAYESITAILSLETAEEKRAAIEASTLPEHAKAWFYYGVVASDEDRAKMEALADRGEDASGVLVVMRVKGAESTAEKYNIVADTRLGFTGADALMSEMMADTTYEKYKEATEAGIGHNDYLRYLADVSGYESDRDEDGKVISGSKKEKILARIDEMSITIAQKDLLYLQAGYSEDAIGSAPWRK